jgi:hypothetical protein
MYQERKQQNSPPCERLVPSGEQTLALCPCADHFPKAGNSPLPPAFRHPRYSFHSWLSTTNPKLPHCTLPTWPLHCTKGQSCFVPVPGQRRPKTSLPCRDQDHGEGDRFLQVSSHGGRVPAGAVPGHPGRAGAGLVVVGGRGDGGRRAARGGHHRRGPPGADRARVQHVRALRRAPRAAPQLAFRSGAFLSFVCSPTVDSWREKR